MECYESRILLLCIAQSQQSTISWDCALRKSSSQSCLPNSPNYLLRSSSNQSPSLLEEITQSRPIIPQVCVKSFLEFALVFADRFLAMNVALSPDPSGVHLPLSSTGSMASKRAGSKDTDESATGVAVEQVSACLSIYEDTKLFLDKDLQAHL